MKRLREIQSSFYMNVMRCMVILEALGVGYFSKVWQLDLPMSCKKLWVSITE